MSNRNFSAGNGGSKYAKGFTNNDIAVTAANNPFLQQQSFVFQQKRSKKRHCEELQDVDSIVDASLDRDALQKRKVDEIKDNLEKNRLANASEKVDQYLSLKRSRHHLEEEEFELHQPKSLRQKVKDKKDKFVDLLKPSRKKRKLKNEESESSESEEDEVRVHKPKDTFDSLLSNIKNNPFTKSLLEEFKEVTKPIEHVCSGYAVHFSSLFDKLEQQCARLYDQHAKSSTLPKIYKQYTDKKFWLRNVNGETILKKLNKTLDELGLVRTDQQKVFHKHMVNATIPKIFGGDLTTHKERILKENNWDDIKQEVLVVTPRRFGKTWGVAMFSAACLIEIPCFEIVIFSMALRASRKMLALIDKFISRHPEGSKMVCHPHTQESLTLKGTEPGDERLCKSFPGRSEVRKSFLPSYFG